MTVVINDRRVQTTTVGGETTRTYDFRILDQDDLVVTRQASGASSPTTLVLGTDYTVSGVGNAGGGTITLDGTAFPTGASADDVWTLYSETELERSTDFQTDGDFLAATVNDQFDDIIHMIQEQDRTLDNSLFRQPTSTETYSLAWPDGALSSAQYLAITTSGLSLVASTELATVVAAANRHSQTFTTDGSQTYTLEADPAVAANVQVFLEGLRQTDFTVSGTTLTLGFVEDSGLTLVVDFGTGLPTALSHIVEDTTPQLGGNLDLNGNVITGLEIGTDVQAYDAELQNLADNITADEITQLLNIGTSVLSAAEWAQVAAIGSATIDATQWGYVGALDQGLATSDAVDFASIGAGTPGTGAFTTVTASGDITANGVIEQAGAATADGGMFISSNVNDTTFNRKFGRNNSTGDFEIRRQQGAGETTDFTINTSGNATLSGGLLMTGATGGLKGAGTINAQAVYDDNTLLTCYVLDAALDGDIDEVKWDARVPDRVIPGEAARKVQKTKTETREVEKVEVIDGKAVRKIETVDVEVREYKEIPVVDENGDPVMDLVALAVPAKLDDDGNEIAPAQDAVYRQRIHREPVMVEVSATEDKVEPRTHRDMRKFKARLGGKYDPTDLDKYIKHWQEKRHLTSLPNEDKYDAENGLSSGEWIQRLVETVELQAVHAKQLRDEIIALRKRVAVLEG